MLLNNYRKILKQSILTRNYDTFLYNMGYQVTRQDGTSVALTAKECQGRDTLICPTQQNSRIYTTLPGVNTLAYDAIYIVFGDGDTPVTVDDYSISGNAISDISFSSIEGLSTDVGGNILYTFVNRGNDVTIKEVCIFGSFSYSNNLSYKVALWREVLDTPLVVPSGSTFTYTISVNAGV